MNMRSLIRLTRQRPERVLNRSFRLNQLTPSDPTQRTERQPSRLR
jgi:hypothetical protein